MPEVVMLVGFPASAKGTLAKTYKGYTILNRDSVGGAVQKLIPKMVVELTAGRNVVLDNTNCTLEDRTPFIAAAKKAKSPIHCVWVDTPLEDCQINALMRMWDRYGRVFFDLGEMKGVSSADGRGANDDPNIFPAVALFAFKKKFVKPSIDEGFATFTRQKFVRQWPVTLTEKALFLDYDDTLRRTLGGGKWPTEPSQIEILPRRSKVLKDWEAKGYKLLGVSNQSGIGAGTMTHEQAQACFNATNKMLGLDIHYRYCHHRPGPIGCYCRKPQSGSLISFIRQYNLDPKQCVFVGDQTTDKTCAERVGIKYVDQAEFFR